MFIVELLGNIIGAILMGYLTFSNFVADQVWQFIPESEEEAVIEEVEESGLEEFAPEEREPLSFIPRVLLDHLEFQEAATIASRRDEEAVILPDGKDLRDAVKDALVNVFCQYTTERFIRTTTGTGFFINQKGVILTNAHVAQFLLLEDSEELDGDVECVIRTGDPAMPRYTAELLYISPSWIYENAELITAEEPRGTGERDYALLYVAKSVDGEPLPAEFPAIPVDVNLLTRSVAGSEVVTAGYPAAVLFRQGADAALTPVIASTTIGTLYTFGSNYADIFSVSESPVGEQGASGGPIVTAQDRDVIGLIVTKGDTSTEGEHSLRAITLSYVDRTIKEETGFSLRENMQGDVAYRGSIFKQAMLPFLASILAEELTN